MNQCIAILDQICSCKKLSFSRRDQGNYHNRGYRWAAARRSRTPRGGPRGVHVYRLHRKKRDGLDDRECGGGPRCSRLSTGVGPGNHCV